MQGEVREVKPPFEFASFLEAQKMIRGDLRHIMLDFEEQKNANYNPVIIPIFFLLILE